MFRGVIPCGMDITASVSEDCQYICIERNGVTSQKTAMFIVHREKLKSHIAITECDIMLKQPVSLRPCIQ